MDTKTRLRTLRKEKKLSQGELGIKIGISLKTISSIETGKIDLSTKQLKALSSFFDVSTDYLLTGKKEIIELSSEEREVLEFMRRDIDFNEAVKQAAKIKKKAINYLSGYTHNHAHAA